MQTQCQVSVLKCEDNVKWQIKEFLALTHRDLSININLSRSLSVCFDLYGPHLDGVPAQQQQQQFAGKSLVQPFLVSAPDVRKNESFFCDKMSF